MRGFLSGLIFGLFLAGGGAAYLHLRPSPPALMRKRKARGATPLGSTPSEDPGEPVAPSGPLLATADLKPLAASGSLLGSQVVDLTRAEAGDDRELSQEELDAVFARALVACIDEARGDARAANWGCVTVSLRVQRSGAVNGVRAEAPTYLMKRGLLECARRAVTPLKLPASGHSQIVSYPFSLR